jgi:GNAT superfamily N-acetyltransferase
VTALDPPLVVGELVGLRVWPLQPYGRLRAAGCDIVWPDGGRPMKATCVVGADHEAPAPGCTCGIYAWHPRPSSAEELFAECSRGGSGVAGIVAAWGAVEVHRTGFRAQYARPLAFVVERGRAGRGYGRRVRRLAARHAAEVVVVGSAAELYDYCTDRGLGLRESAVEDLLAPEREEARARRRRRLMLQRAAVALSAPAALGAAALLLGS